MRYDIQVVKLGGDGAGIRVNNLLGQPLGKFNNEGWAVYKQGMAADTPEEQLEKVAFQAYEGGSTPTDWNRFAMALVRVHDAVVPRVYSNV